MPCKIAIFVIPILQLNQILTCPVMPISLLSRFIGLGSAQVLVGKIQTDAHHNKEEQVGTGPYFFPCSAPSLSASSSDSLSMSFKMTTPQSQIHHGNTTQKGLISKKYPAESWIPTSFHIITIPDMDDG